MKFILALSLSLAALSSRAFGGQESAGESMTEAKSAAVSLQAFGRSLDPQALAGALTQIKGVDLKSPEVQSVLAPQVLGLARDLEALAAKTDGKEEERGSLRSAALGLRVLNDHFAAVLGGGASLLENSNDRVNARLREGERRSVDAKASAMAASLMKGLRSREAEGSSAVAAYDDHAGVPDVVSMLDKSHPALGGNFSLGAVPLDSPKGMNLSLAADNRNPGQNPGLLDVIFHGDSKVEATLLALLLVIGLTLPNSWGKAGFLAFLAAAAVALGALNYHELKASFAKAAKSLKNNPAAPPAREIRLLRTADVFGLLPAKKDADGQ